MTKLNFFKKFLIFYLLAALIVQPALVGAASLRIKRNLIEDYGVSFTEIDRFKCYKGRSYIDENLLDPPYFNFSNYENLTIVLREELDKLINNELYGFKEYEVYGGSGPDLMFDIIDDSGDVYSFRSEEGYWWALSRDIAGFEVYNPESLGQIKEEYKKTHENFRPIIRSVERAVAQFVPSEPLTGSFCDMESFYGEQNLLHLVNIYLSSSNFDEIGCKYSEGNLYADCSNSSIYQSINNSNDFWNFKDSEAQLTYKSGNNFIFLDRSDIGFVEGERKADTLGFMIVISQSNFFKGFGNGQSIFVGGGGHLDYLQTLDETYRDTQKIKALNDELNDKIIELNDNNQELNNIFRSSDDLEEKHRKLQNLPEFNTSFINENRILLVYYESYYDKENIFHDRTRNEYFGDYYGEISQDYLEDLDLGIRNLKSNLDYVEKRNDIYTENQRDILVNVQSQLESLENQKISNFSLVATLLFATMVLFVSLSMNMLVHISNKYSDEVVEIARSRMLLILGLMFVVSLSFIFLVRSHGFSYRLFVFIILYLLILVYYVFKYMTDFLFYKNVLKIAKEKRIKKPEKEK